MTGREERTLKLESSNQELIKRYPEVMQSFYYSLSKLSVTTKRQYMSELNVTFTGIYGDGYTEKDILGTDMDKINRYFTSRGNTVKESIVSQQLYALNKFYNFLLKRELIKKNPVDIKELKPSVPDKQRIIYLTWEQGKEVMQAIKNGVGSENAKKRQKKWMRRDLLMFSIMFCKGMRISALLDMNVEDIDFENHQFCSIGKGEKEMKFMITKEDEALIKAWLWDRQQILKEYHVDTNALFIAYHHGRVGRMTTDGAYTMIQKYTAAIGCKISPHKLRSSFGTLFQAEGQDLALTQEAMGHANISTTRRYVPKDTVRQNEIMARISRDMLN